MIFEICAIVATVMLIILTIYIVQTLGEVQKSLKNVNKSLSTLEVEVAVLKLDLNKLLHSSTELVEKINSKISDLDPLFKTVNDAGNAFNARHQSFRDSFRPIEEKMEEAKISEKILDIIDLTKIGIKLYQQFKKGNSL